MSNSNSKQWSSATPGYIIFLVDQSGSMAESYAEGKNRSEFTALVINRTINELINTNMDGEKVKDRVFISMIGYGGSSALAVDDIRSDYLSSFADNPLRMEQLKKKVSDGAGGLIEIDEQMPIFIEPTANGLTPMADALSFAKELIEGWLQKKPDNPAPIIINISDGLPYTGDSIDAAMNKAISVSKQIMNINSSDGNPLIFNSHIGDEGAAKCGFEESESELSDDQAKFLFKISSKVPESYKQAAVKQDFKVKAESRGFVSNADPEMFIKFINFGSSGGADKIA
ncbi:VWA domain-containing protein [Arenibacter sp. M-2]|uniref:vWA domain-containing protein n=1 Tax=Arenibacter sp. M-2 TaxID=3053612 RepID=UPI002570D777|nr:vWA domain-containing protein [Arenibacter sp. M-2]MDL5514818.1 VWA domain-containing protein [Arenibacter sp. M-2]